MFRWKEYVTEVYRARSFSRAAENMFISQPSLSAKIKSVEEEVGAPIFDRSTSPLRLTEVGEEYIRAAEEIGAVESRFEGFVADLKGLRRGSVSIGASNVFAAFILPSIITEFKNKYPDIRVTLTEGNTESLAELLERGAIDLVIDNNSYDLDLYDRELYSEERILLALPKVMPVYEKTKDYQLTEDELKNRCYRSDSIAPVPLSTFAETPFVMLARHNDTRSRADALCREAGFIPRVILELNQQATAYMVSATEIGATFVSDTVAEHLPAYGKLAYYKLSGDKARRGIYFYCKKHKQKNRAAEAFIGLIRERRLKQDQDNTSRP